MNAVQRSLPKPAALWHGLGEVPADLGPTVLALPSKNANAHEVAPSGFKALDLPVDREGVRTHVEG